MPPYTGTLQRALVGSPLRTTRGGCLFFLGMGLLLLLALFGHVFLWAFAPLPALAIALLGMLQALLVSIPALLVLGYLDRRERESIWVMLGMVFWGAVIGTGISSIFNSIFGAGAYLVLALLTGGSEEVAAIGGSLLTAAIAAPLVEETAKGLGVLLVFWLLRAEFDNARDGIIYGGLIGIGFGIAEFGLYLMNLYLEDQQLLWLDLMALRLPFFGLNNHMLWTALVGAGIGYLSQSPRNRRALQPLVALYALAIIGHALNNSIGLIMIALLMEIFGYNTAEQNTIASFLAAWISSVTLNLSLQFIPYLTLIILLVRTARWERRVIQEQLADEVGTAYVTPEEYQLIKREPPFGVRRIPGYRKRESHALVNAQNELAFRKWQVRRAGGNLQDDALVAAWRNDILAHRQQIAE